MARLIPYPQMLNQCGGCQQGRNTGFYCREHGVASIARQSILLSV